MAVSEENSIKQFYNGAEIFITGGSGFVGKALIEKLLRSCPGIKRIYLLMRLKKGMSVQQRLHKLTDNAVSKIDYFIRFFIKILPVVRATSEATIKFIRQNNCDPR